MSHHDQLHRYLFADKAVRGELVNVNNTFTQMVKNHHYPAPVQRLLGELLVATSLLTATLKFNGDITVQLQGDGPLNLAVINGNNRQEMRGMARMQGVITDGSSMQQMLGKAIMVITLTPEEGERYQGIVALEKETLAECLQDYFMQSEQLPTQLFILTGEHQGQPAAAGMLLQVLPAESNNQEDLLHLSHLTATVKAEELFGLPANDVLYRLYNQEEVTLYSPQDVSFSCRCSRERTADALLSLPLQEIDTILAEEGNIDMHCDYCGKHYVFDKIDIDVLRAQGQHNSNQHFH